MIKKWFILTFNIIAIFGVAWHFLLRTPESSPESRMPQSPSDFAYTDINGSSHRLSDFKGKVILVHFWASWCAPCVEEFPQLIALAKSEPERITVIALSSDTSEKKIRQFIRKWNIPANMDIVWDENRRITYDQFQTMNYPETILIGCDYTMYDKVIGMSQDWPGTVKPLLSDCALQTSDAPHSTPLPAAR